MNKFVKMLKNKMISVIITVCFSLSLQAQEYAFETCIDLGDAVKTIDCLNDYMKKNPKDVDALLLRAICFHSLNEYLLALSDLDDAIRYHDKKVVAKKDYLYGVRANIYTDIENYNEALNDYSSALKINPKNIDALSDRAYLFYKLKNYSASDADWNQILKLENNNIKAQIGLCFNMITQGQVDNAIKELDRLEKIDSRNRCFL